MALFLGILLREGPEVEPREKLERQNKENTSFSLCVAESGYVCPKDWVLGRKY